MWIPLLVGLSLGCAGAGEAIMDLTGAEMAVGEDAEHPADFPLSAPSEGTIMTSMKMGIGGVRTTTVQYEIPSSVDQDALMQSYEDELTADGGEVVEQTHDGSRTLTRQGDGGSMVTVALTPQGDKAILSLVSVTKDE